MTALLTKVTASRPSVISKVFTLSDGDIKKETSADVYAGLVQRISIGDLKDFAVVLKGLSHSQCLVYGLGPRDEMELVTEKSWAQAGRPGHQVARTKAAFHWNDGPGILMLDYDPASDDVPKDRNTLIKAVRTVCPALANTQMLWWPSASSNIYNGETDEELRGIRGQRLYIMVSDARDIPRTGKALSTHLWAAGFGHFEVSKSGALLERGLFDTSVWQTNRPDFAGGAKCNPPLVQKRGDPVCIEGSDLMVDTAVAIPEPDSSTTQRANDNKAMERSLKKDAAEAQQEIWIAKRVEELTESVGKQTGEKAEQARKSATAWVRRVLDRSELFADWRLTVKHPDSQQAVTVKVSDVLDNPYQWHGCLTLDPIEPDYDGGRWVGKLFLIGARPILYSFAHGGHSFKLLRQLHRIEIVRGKMHDVTNNLIEVLRRSPEIFDYGTEMATPTGGGKLLRLDKDNLRYVAGGITQFWKFVQLRSGEMIEQLENAPPDVAASVIALRGLRKLRRLDAVISAPMLRTDGTLLTSPGYDAKTCLLLDMYDEQQLIAEYPTEQQLMDAYFRLMKPFESFPFVKETDRGVLFAALLTAIVRPVLKTSPAFAFDATQHGTGKTILAECCAVLATGERPITWPHVSNNEEETRKRLLTVLRSGSRVLLWDNIVGQFDSPSLAVLLTSDVYTDRVLGVSGSEVYPNRLLTIFTGNNFTPTGELTRRVLTCRLDAKTERPYTRKFDFNPTDLCLAERQALVAAGVTLLKGYANAGRPRMAPPLGSFGEWDSMVRQAVLWVEQHVLAGLGGLGDPVQSILDQAATDPVDEAHGLLMLAWRKIYGDQLITARDLHKAYSKSRREFNCPTESERELADALDEFKTGHEFTSKSIGRVLHFRRDRIVNGMRIVRSSTKSGGTCQWRVQEIQANST